MKQIKNKEYAQCQQYLRDRNHGRVLTSNGLRIICAAHKNESRRRLASPTNGKGALLTVVDSARMIMKNCLKYVCIQDPRRYGMISCAKREKRRYRLQSLVE